jgi:XRE family transcriptional regulator, regulator of sulfur utilization
MDPRSPGHTAFGRAIRELREERGIAQEAFALGCDIDRSHYSGMERGERNPSLSMIFKIAAALDVPASEILARAEAIQGRQPESR